MSSCTSAIPRTTGHTVFKVHSLLVLFPRQSVANIAIHKTVASILPNPTCGCLVRPYNLPTSILHINDRSPRWSEPTTPTNTTSTVEFTALMSSGIKKLHASVKTLSVMGCHSLIKSHAKQSSESKEKHGEWPG